MENFCPFLQKLISFFREYRKLIIVKKFTITGALYLTRFCGMGKYKLWNHMIQILNKEIKIIFQLFFNKALKTGSFSEVNGYSVQRTLNKG